ncbi:MAG: hypothetical protein V7727_22225, partial [Sneathiella sp.]
MCLVAFVLWSNFSQHNPITGLSKPKIAVLPFLNVTGDPDDAYLANGFTTEMIVAMARSEHLVVISRTASANVANEDVERIGEKLSAQYIIRGNIGKNDSNLRISAELTDTETGDIVWAKVYSQPLKTTEVFEASADIAEQISRAVTMPYGVVFTQEISRSAPAEFSSYQCILKAYDYERKRGAQYHSEVRECLEITVQREPELATAWALLSAAYLDEFRDGYNQLGAPLDRALMAALHAVDLTSEDDAQSQWALATVYYFQKEQVAFLESAQHVLKLAPNDADLIANIGFKQVISGSDWEGGVKLMDQAMKMSPAHPSTWYFPRALFEYRRNAYEDA